jgi:selenocysteine-specific elongation factor
MEIHGRAVERSEPGARTAIGIAGLERAAATRGTVLVDHDAPWAGTRALDVEITLESSASRAIGPRTRLRLHLGTAEVMARAYPRGSIEPGGRGLARLALEEPVVARGDDRFVLRSYSPVTTVGGGRVLDPEPPRRRRPWPDELAAPEPAPRFRALLARRPAGIPADSLPILLGVTPAAAQALGQAEPSARLVGSLWVRGSVLDELAARALELIRQFHRAHISERGMPLETLRHSLGSAEALADAALADLIKANRIRSAGGVVALAGFAPRVEGGEAEIDRIVRLLQEAQLSPPTIGELERSTGRRDLSALLRLAATGGRVEAVERDRYYAREALERFTAALAEVGQTGAGDIVPAALRDRLGISRKYLIPLLEWADAKGITVRVGESRRLRRAPELA